MTESIPTNTPRDVQDHLNKMKALMAEDDVDETSEDTIDEHVEPENNEIELTDFKKPSKPKSYSRTYRLSLTHDLYKLRFDVRDISVADYQLAIRVPKTDFKFEPQPNSRFLLECMGKEYSVIYLGGLFDFPSDDSWSLTFMMDTNDDTWTQPS